MIFLIQLSGGQGRHRYIQFQETKRYNVIQGKHTGRRVQNKLYLHQVEYKNSTTHADAKE